MQSLRVEEPVTEVIFKMWLQMKVGKGNKVSIIAQMLLIKWTAQPTLMRTSKIMAIHLYITITLSNLLSRDPLKESSLMWIL